MHEKCNRERLLSPEVVVGALDGFLARLAGGGRAPARDEIQDGVHPAAALGCAGSHQALRVAILP